MDLYQVALEGAREKGNQHVKYSAPDVNWECLLYSGPWRMARYRSGLVHRRHSDRQHPSVGVSGLLKQGVVGTPFPLPVTMGQPMIEL